MIYRIFFTFLVSAILLLTGCVITPRAEDGKPLLANQGILAIKITSNAKARIGIQPFSKESSYASRFAENAIGPKAFVFFKESEEYVLIPLEAGDYMWSKIEMGRMFSWMQSSNRFTVKPNTITYAGDLQLTVTGTVFSLRVYDREADMRNYIKQSFQNYSNSMKFEKILAILNI
jgi:hypothetical protein